ncbi:MAG: hypothetical protein P4L28_00325 [Paludibacteraceae bacterium]|nr:hypothetical protein [Paludibacteraceae bacterium]
MYYDTINGWMPSIITGSTPNAIATHLSDVSEIYNQRYGHSLIGKINNYSITINETGIYFHGSLSKFLHGNNIEPFTLSDTKQAIEKLSNILHVPFKEAKINRIDLGCNLITQYSPAIYYKCLGNKPHFERLIPIKDTLYYNTQKRQLAFYDKAREAKRTKTNIPEPYANNNLLRYELRFKKNLCKQLNQNEITGATLYDEQFHLKLAKLWKAEYFSIQKTNGKLGEINFNNIKKPSDVKNAILASMLVETDINDIVTNLKARNVFPDPKYYSRTKNELNALLTASSTEPNELIIELDKKMNEAIKQF